MVQGTSTERGCKMYTLSLDEYGKFEEMDTKSVFIAGVIYDDCNIQYEISQERKRIRLYYKRVFADVSAKLGVKLDYPRALHLSRNDTEERIYQVKEIKSLVEETLSEFLREGTYKSEALKDSNGRDFPARKGRYLLYCMIKSANGKKARISESAGCLLDDAVASNLYFHMASEVIGRTVFNNPLVNADEHFSLEIATRVTKTFEKGSAESKEYKELAYTVRHPIVKGEYDRQNEFFEVTNADIFRTAITQHAMENNPRNIIIDDFKVMSIDYNNADKHCINELLYLADSVCSFISYKLDVDNDLGDARIKKTYKKASNLLPKDRVLVFGYDDIDIEFGKALLAYNARDFYNALCICYDSINHEGSFNRFYESNWFPYIRDSIINSTNIGALKRAVNALYDSHFSNTYKQDRVVYILDTLTKQAENLIEKLDNYSNRRILVKLYEIGVVTYCHIGDWKKAENFFDKFNMYRSYTDVETYIRVKRMLCVCYCDGFKWDKGLKLATEIVDNEKALSFVKRSIYDGETNALSEAKALSQLGQVYSFMRDDRAENTFIYSLAMMDKDDPDYNITLSYLMHYYIDSGDKEKYDIRSKELFSGCSSFREQFEHILDEGLNENPDFNLKFALYVFIKGMYVFHKDEMTAELWKKVRNIEKYVNSQYKTKLTPGEKWTMSGHPTELIYKYVLLFAVSRGDSEIYERYENTIDDAVKEKDILVESISVLSKAEVAEMLGDKKKKNRYVKAVSDWQKELIPELKNSSVQKTEKLIEVLDKYFTYMYC